jgi:hypothetical protein
MLIFCLSYSAIKLDLVASRRDSSLTEVLVVKRRTRLPAVETRAGLANNGRFHWSVDGAHYLPNAASSVLNRYE